MSKINFNPKFSFSTFLLLPFIIFTCNLSQTTHSKMNRTTGGLLLKMIHIDSPDSPMYQPELTNVERAKRLLGVYNSTISNTTKEYVSQNYDPDVFAKINKQGKAYYVEIGIGQFNDYRMSFHKNYLAFDTGSDYVWTQCENCRLCFPQRHSLFPRYASNTYRPFPCNQCGGTCLEDHCTDRLTYGDGTDVLGFKASENFVFVSEFVDGLEFLCAIETRDFKTGSGPNNIISGILGIDTGPTSLISQLGARAQYRFSYCLRDRARRREGQSPMFLSFGIYIQPPPFMSTTPILGSIHNYYVGLIDISVDGTRLHIPVKYFSLKRDNSGGTIIDTGMISSRFVSPVFDRLIYEIASYISDNNSNMYLRRHTDPNDFGLEACWESLVSTPPVDFPDITFHFQGDANMVVRHTQVITTYSSPRIPDPGLYCLTMYRAQTRVNKIGGFQQINQRVIIDIETKEFSFAQEDYSLSTW